MDGTWSLEGPQSSSGCFRTQEARSSQPLGPLQRRLAPLLCFRPAPFHHLGPAACCTSQCAQLFSHSPHLVREDVDHLQEKIVSTTQQRNEAFSVNHCEFGVLHGLCCQTVGLIGKGGWQPEDVAQAHRPVGELSVGTIEREPHSPLAHDECSARSLSLAEENRPPWTYNRGPVVFES